jgi:hypothetical protein
MTHRISLRRETRTAWGRPVTQSADIKSQRLSYIIRGWSLPRGFFLCDNSF